jgi:hypothetical protein
LGIQAFATGLLEPVDHQLVDLCSVEFRGMSEFAFTLLFHFFSPFAGLPELSDHQQMSSTPSVEF